mgnify:CR=1|tara:strand:+ start:138 stop:509 length:372 start_codon:yes stop_codon:yes gene_type:complete
MEKGIVEKMIDCREWIESALEYSGGTHDFKDIVDGVIAGNMQFWEAPKGCAITEVIIFPKKKVLHIFLAAGEMQQIVDMDESAVAWGKSIGCNAVSIAGRRGWKKVLEKKGYEEQFTTLAKDI